MDSLLERIERAISQGELWRAKEMLQGAIRVRGYDPVLFERLGLVLLQMGDLVEAGKYLFLSGQRQASYERAIALFVGRYTRKQPLHLYYSFPRAARLERREKYPPQVAAELARLGLPEKFTVPRGGKDAGPAWLGAKLLQAGCVVAMALLVVLAVLGVLWVLQRFAAQPSAADDPAGHAGFWKFVPHLGPPGS